MLDTITSRVQHRFFYSILSNNLIYNTCWEDPRIDRQLLQLSDDSDIVMITSAGCNALDYLLDNPNSIHCIDRNPRQNALLEFKKQLFKTGSYHLLASYFMHGMFTEAERWYRECIRPDLGATAAEFWDEHLSYFEASHSKRSFYFKSTSGNVAWMVNKYLDRKGLTDTIDQLLDAESLGEQKYHFSEIEETVWTRFARWIVNRNATMAMLGVPVSQRKLIDEAFAGGLQQFIADAIKHVCTELPIHDNYFWRVYLTGSYTPSCCPEYLKEEHFDTLRERVDRITTNTTLITDFLRSTPGHYSHYVLLDHQDWLANHSPDALEEEWRLILKNSRPGTRILFRSAGVSIDFLPDFIHHHVRFMPGLTEPLHKRDRVGTYGSTHLAIVE